MIITCIKGGLLPDFNKCIPFGEHDLAMYIGEDTCFVFYDILDCKTQSRFSLTTFLDIDKDAHITKEEIDFRANYFNRHRKALIDRALRNANESIFFNSIESEVLSKYFYDMKFACKVDIFIQGQRVDLKDIVDKKEFNHIVEFTKVFNMCECIDAVDMAHIKLGIYEPKIDKKKKAISSLIIASIGVVAGTVIGFKLGSNKVIKGNDTMNEEEA